MGAPVPVDDLPDAAVQAVPLDDLPSGYQPPSAATISKTAGALGRKASEAAQNALSTRDKGVDYSGIDRPSTQAAYSLISKPEDRTAYLKSVFGEKNVSKDSFGRDIIVGGDKKISFLPITGGETGKNLGAQFAGLAGEVAPAVGMAAGMAVGAPAGPVTGMAMSGGGGAAGVALNQLIGRAIGLPNTQDSSEAAKDIVTQGMIPGAMGEGLARGAGFVGRSLMAPYAEGSVFGPWAKNAPRFNEQMGEVDAARGYGLTPHIGTVSPNARLVQRVQGMSGRIFGDEIPQMNKPILEGNVNSLTASGAGGTVPPSLSGSEALNKGLSAKADAALSSAEATAKQAMSDADRILAQARARVSADVGAPKGGLSTSVEADIRKSREDFGSKATELYKPIDDFAGGPVVPTEPIKAVLKNILSQMPPTKQGGVSVLVPENLRGFAQGVNELPEMVTFQQMQAIRHKFYSKSDVAALNAGLSDRQALQLAKAADSAFDEAGAAFTKKTTSPVLDASGKPITNTVSVPASAEAQQAALALRRADQFYKAGVSRYDDMTVEALVKDATQGGFVQPEKLAKYIATPGQTDKLLRVKKVLSPETFKEVGAQRWQDMLGDATNPLTGSLDGSRLVKAVSGMGKSLDVLYGADASQIRALAAHYGALGGKVPIDLLGAGNIKTAIEKAITEQTRLDKIVRSDWIGAIKSDGPQSLHAADYLTAPDNRLQLRKAIATFGPTAPETTALKEYLARRIFATMEKPATMGAEKYSQTELMGEPLVAELNRYGRPYLEEVFGKPWADEAFKFAKAAEVGTRKNPTDSGGIVAAALSISPMRHLGTIAKIFAGGELLANPTVLTYLSKGMQGGTADFLREVGMLGTRATAVTGATTIPKDIQDASNAAQFKAQQTLGSRLGNAR